MSSVLDTPLMFLKGVGEVRAGLLAEVMQLHTFRDLLYYYPFRHNDRTSFTPIAHINPEAPTVQLKGVIRNIEVIGHARAKRLTATLSDASGTIELVWFNGITWLKRYLKEDALYIVYGKPNLFQRQLNVMHPEIELAGNGDETQAGKFDPMYSVPDKLKNRGISSKVIARMTQELFRRLQPAEIPECIPDAVRNSYRLTGRYQAMRWVHHPADDGEKQQAVRRLKFEELFLDQVRILRIRGERHRVYKGIVFKNIDNIFMQFYRDGLPFPLTEAQKRVLKEIRSDVVSGNQMNRLLQGDVGSGKTIVALMAMLMAIDNGYQTCLMAPTEILARQHFAGFVPLLASVGVRVDLLTGNIKGKERKAVLERLASGDTGILIGTHALIEAAVQFRQLGMVVIDEQHRFGVEQRAKLWTKNDHPPHMLVMTATPIPRTLSMTLYGDLDVSVIDELPPGRKEIRTIHYRESKRLLLFGFLNEQIALGRQVYIVYPLIEESEKLDLNNLMEGYRGLERDFPRPTYTIGMVHGRMTQQEKDFEMQRFVAGKSNILVSTTVIEVGVNVPNATVMVIENAERFGLAQLHQLRGRVGRGAHQSFCVLMTGDKLSNDGRTRIRTMVETTDGFKISEVDMALRGPGEMEGTRQSGHIGYLLADLKTDLKVLEAARASAEQILEEDPLLEKPAHFQLSAHLKAAIDKAKFWGKVS